MFATLFTIFAAVTAATSLNDIPGTATVGEITADKRDKTDLTVYEESVDAEIQFAAECLPVADSLPFSYIYFSPAQSPDGSSIPGEWDANVSRDENSAVPEFSLHIVGAVAVDWAPVGNDRFNIASVTFGGKPFKAGEWPHLKTGIVPTADRLATTGEVAAVISPDNAAFSNAVLSVGIGVDTNAVAAINALLDGEGDALPVGGAATVGGLLAALAAALAALKKKVMEKYPFVAATIAGDTLTLTPFSRNALTSDGTAFTVRMSGDGTYLRDCVLVVTAGATAPNISWGEVGGQTFAPRTDAATDMEIAANTTKVFWVTEYAPDCFAVAGWEVPSVSE